MPAKKIFTVVLAIALLTPWARLPSQKSAFICLEVQPGAGCSILIQWESTADTNILKYEVEKSGDQEKWVTIAHRSLRSSQQYLVIDAAPYDNLNYYRIKLVDNKNSFSYSDTRWVQVNTITDVFIWANPAGDILRIKTPFLGGGIDLTDAGGKLLRRIVITDFISDLSIEGLQKGIYMLTISSGNRSVTEKFIKV